MYVVMNQGAQQRKNTFRNLSNRIDAIGRSVTLPKIRRVHMSVLPNHLTVDIEF